MQYVLDTNSILYYLKRQKNLSQHFVNIVEGSDLISLSVVTKIELFSYPGLQIDEENKIKEFINDFKVDDLENDIVDKTIEIRKKYKLKLPDAIISATALINNAILITHNKKCFEKVIELKVVNPLEKE
ncbi:type II toxin-antitoxin system VapC family toxin [Candidatus Parcubacteria bacterium]|nr:type II toxin-antitoxin system VapC family toxin [Candidatus Parcubacteria bacterium]